LSKSKRGETRHLRTSVAHQAPSQEGGGIIRSIRTVFRSTVEKTQGRPDRTTAGRPYGGEPTAALRRKRRQVFEPVRAEGAARSRAAFGGNPRSAPAVALQGARHHAKVSRAAGSGRVTGSGGTWLQRLAPLALVLAVASGAASGQSITFDVAGGDAALTRRLEAASSLRAAERDGTVTAQDLLAAARAEYATLLAALYAQGRYSGVISIRIDGREAATIAPLDAPQTVRDIVVRVDPGPVFAFSRAEIGPLAPETEIPKGYAIGAPAETGVIRAAAAAAVAGRRCAGHAKAAVGDQELTVNHANAALSAAIRMDPGPRLRFGRFTVSGQERMREERIRAIAGFPEGEVFDPALLTRSAERLRRSGVFRSVAVTEAETPGPDGTLDIGTQLIEELPRRYGFGGEIASSDGLDLSAYWMHRNLFGGAERLRIEGSATNIGSTDSGTDYSLGITLDRPATFTPDTLLGIALQYDHIDDIDQVIDLGQIGVQATQFVSDRLTLTAGLQYRYQRVTDDTGDFTYNDVALPLGVIYDARDNRFDPTRGYFVNAGLTPFVGFDDTDSGGQVTLDARAYRGFGADRPVVLAGRLQLGSILGASLIGTPRDYLFYSGGGGTVRGQPFQSLGVKVLGPDTLTGGTEFLAASVELRAMVTDTIGLVGFYDAGYVGAGSEQNFNTDDWQAGAGLGLRYATGFGPIRLDIAAPVGGDTGDGVQFYVGIGQAF
jgi:translocation and assembly module TamA